MFDCNITVTRPYRGVIADVPAQAIVASMPEFAKVLVPNVEAKALSMAKLRKGRKRLRFVEAKITLNGYRLTITPKGPLVHLLDRGVAPHSLAPKKLSGTMAQFGYGWHPGFAGRRFVPAALQASKPEMQRILDRNTVTFLAKVEHP